MKHFLTLLSVLFLVSLMVDSASAVAVVVPTKKNNITMCVQNFSGSDVAVIFDPEKDFDDYFDGDGDFLDGDFQRDGGQFINQGGVGEFKLKAGNHVMVAVDAGVIDDVAIREFNLSKGEKKVYSQVIRDDHDLRITFRQGQPR